MTQREQEEAILDALADIKAIFERNRREFSARTSRHFLDALREIPVGIIPAVIREMIFKPSKNGDFVHYVPEPADVLAIAKRFTVGGHTTVAEIAQEIFDNINRHGVYGVLVEYEREDGSIGGYQVVGAPPLSPLAMETVKALGGWVGLCQSETPDGVLRGQVNKAAEGILEREWTRPMIDLSAIGGVQRELIGGKV